MSIECQYCKNKAELVTGKEIYSHREDLFGLKFWQCKSCDAYVGCHKADKDQGDGTKPLGVLANAELRTAKSRAHKAFDPIWKNKMLKRSEAYKWLAGMLDIDAKDCHIGMFSVEQCRNVAAVSKLFTSKSSLTKKAYLNVFFIDGPKKGATELIQHCKRRVVDGGIYECVFAGPKGTASFKLLDRQMVELL